MRKIFSLSAIAIAVLAIAISQLWQKPVSKWHQGAAWERLFTIYDKMAAEQFQDCDPKLVETRFGDTMVHACGNDGNPPVLLFHGLSSSALIYGDWLVPTLREKYYTVSVDALCDVTRSLPKLGDPKSCPQTTKEMYEWMIDIKTQLKIDKPVSAIGYSYGAFMATHMAMEGQKRLDQLQNEASTHSGSAEADQKLTGLANDQIDEIILIAPAAVVAPFSTQWLVRAIAFGLLRTMSGSFASVKTWLRDWFFTYMMSDFKTAHLNWSSDQRELRAALDDAGPVQVAVPASEVDMDSLKGLARRHDMLLIIGDKETVTDPTVAVSRAKETGIHVREYKGAGHMMLVEFPRNPIKLDVLQFLDGSYADN
ncbi:hypothetical protein MPSEU_000683900 [Mayamaea pseudoterrestris]|nr:hypothetical protein MPSEU_000683900 [Mayamaea pseudoterrestris]